MKKTYIAPFCKIREVKKCDIIATSFSNANNTKGYDGGIGGFGRGSSWDDDEDDEW